MLLFKYKNIYNSSVASLKPRLFIPHSFKSCSGRRRWNATSIRSLSILLIAFFGIKISFSWLCSWRYLRGFYFINFFWGRFVMFNWDFWRRWRDLFAFLFHIILCNFNIPHLIFWYFPIYKISFSNRIPCNTLFRLLYAALLLRLRSFRNLTFYLLECLIYNPHQITHSKSLLLICLGQLILLPFDRAKLLFIILVFVSSFVDLFYYF